MTVPRHFWRLIDAVLVAAALVVAVRLAASHRPPHRVTYQRPPLIAVGRILTLPTLDWPQAERHVVLRARTTCPSCNESIPFFRDISRCTRGIPSIRFAIVTEESIETMNKWLATNNIVVDQVVRNDVPYRLGFLLIPTLLIADRTGKVSDILVGTATDSIRSHFISRLASGSTATAVDNTDYAEEIDITTLAGRERRHKVTVLDIRRREEFSARHWPGALNIPHDELSVRAAREIASSTEIAIDCTRMDSLPCRSAGAELQRQRPGPVVIVFP